MRPIVRFCFCCLCAGLITSSSPVLHGYVLADGDGTQNTSAPADDPGWDNHGNTGPATGVYLGDGWMLVPHHVLGSGSTTNLGGTNYSLRTEMRVRLHNPGDWNDVNDLVMIPVINPPTGLPVIAIATTPPSPGSTGGGPPQPAETLTMIGIGRDREPGLTYWIIGGGTAEEVEEVDSWTHRGYKTFTTRTKRWGTNTRPNNNLFDVLNTRSFATQFNDVANNTQGVIGDSGGGIFVKRNGEWFLAGVSLSVSAIPEGPDNFTRTRAIFNQFTFHADLSHFRDQIETIRSLSTPYEVYLYQHLQDDWDPALADPLADLDGDGRVNLLEYAFNTDPQAPSQERNPFMHPVGAEEPPRFRYFRFTDRTDLLYQAEWSTDLVDWFTDDLSDTVVATSDTQQTREVVHTGDPEVRRFFRLRVELTE